MFNQVTTPIPARNYDDMVESIRALSDYNLRMFFGGYVRAMEKEHRNYMPQPSTYVLVQLLLMIDEFKRRQTTKTNHD